MFFLENYAIKNPKIHIVLENSWNFDLAWQKYVTTSYLILFSMNTSVTILLVDSRV